jgi:hypothetical protein
MNVEPVVQPKAAPHCIQGRALRGRIQAPQRWGAEDAGIIGDWSEGRRLPPLIKRFMLFAEVRDLYDPDCRIQMC